MAQILFDQSNLKPKIQYDTLEYPMENMSYQS